MAEENKSQLISEAELIEEINADSLLSISLGAGQPQKNVKLSTLASVVAGIIGFGDTVPRHRGTIPGMDCNEATAAGFYYYYTEQGALSNSPSIARFVLEVSVAGSRIVQTATSFSTATGESGYGKMKTRAFSGSSWTPWAER